MKKQAKATKYALAALCLCAAGMCGCFTRRTPARPYIDAFDFPRPLMPATTGTDLEPPPTMPFEIVAAPAQLETSRAVPARPRVAVQPVPEPSPAERSAEPTIAPELTAEESESAKADTQRNLILVDKNLTLAWGRKLNASQQDLASKIKGFTGDAKEAMQNGDWERAKNLSRKAVVLSDQLAGSL